MKKIKIILSLILIAGLGTISGQSGSIKFEEIRKIEIKLEGEMAARLKDFPKEQKTNRVLYFTKDETLYTLPENDGSEDVPDFNAGEGGVKIRMSSAENKVFANFKDNNLIEQREFMTRTFIIEAKIEPGEWKISGNQKMILDYQCMEATTTDTAGVVTQVWFAPTFPAKGGPARFCNLPGMVLEVNIGDGKQQYIARSVSMEAPTADLFKVPKDGKKVTQEEFDNIVAEKMKEMGAQGSGGAGTFIIKIKK
jgi:GLPGLI family protein